MSETWIRAKREKTTFSRLASKINFRVVATGLCRLLRW